MKIPVAKQIYFIRRARYGNASLFFYSLPALVAVLLNRYDNPRQIRIERGLTEIFFFLCFFVLLLGRFSH